MPDSFNDCVLVARSELAAARRMLNAEISSYPSPISGCDAQFNHLLAERERIGAALRSLDQEVFVPTPRSPNRSVGVESR